MTPTELVEMLESMDRRAIEDPRFREQLEVGLRLATQRLALRLWWSRGVLSRPVCDRSKKKASRRTPPGTDVDAPPPEEWERIAELVRKYTDLRARDLRCWQL